MFNVLLFTNNKKCSTVSFIKRCIVVFLRNYRQTNIKQVFQN